MDVFLILAVWIDAIIAIPFALGRHSIGRPERMIPARRYIGRNDVFVRWQGPIAIHMYLSFISKGKRAPTF